jgi:hypothetical protein
MARDPLPDCRAALGSRSLADVEVLGITANVMGMPLDTTNIREPNLPCGVKVDGLGSSLMIEIDLVMQELGASSPVFTSEWDFQKKLVKAVERRLPDARFECPCRFERIRIDLGIYLGGSTAVIELKYKTRKFDVILDGKHFALKNTSVRPEARYDFVKDIKRLERYVRCEAGSVGWAIILTNDHLLWELGSGGISEEFCIADGLRMSGTCKWKDGCAAGRHHPRQDNLNLAGTYNLRWAEYSDLPGKCGRFRYLAVKIDP